MYSIFILKFKFSIFKVLLELRMIKPSFIINLLLSFAFVVVVSYFELAFSIQYFNSVQRMTVMNFFDEYFNYKTGLLIFYNIILKGIFHYSLTKMVVWGAGIKHNFVNLFLTDDSSRGKIILFL